MVAGARRKGDPDYLNAARNSAELLKEKLGFAPVQLHRHVPYALSKSVLAEIEDNFPDTFDEFRQNKFRKSNDINIPSFFYHHYALATRRATMADCTSVLAKSNDVRWRSRLKEAKKPECEILCINDGGDFNSSGSWESAVDEFLNQHFDKAAPWEKRA